MSMARRPTRPALSRDYILDRALALIDREGVEAFTMRRLGAETGADPMAIYYYFPSKAALFDGIVERVYLEIEAGAIGEGGDPRERVAEGLRAMRKAFLRHPRALPIVSTRPANTRAMAALMESFLSMLKDSGLGPEPALDAVACFTVYVIGHALAQAGEPVGGAEPLDLGVFDEFPLLKRAADSPRAYDPDRQFELGLGALIEGLLKPGPSLPEAGPSLPEAGPPARIGRGRIEVDKLDRDEALRLWRQHNDDDYLYRHALSVEAAMRRFAAKYGEDPEYWGIVGLLHDIDFQKFPEEHLQHARGMLEGAGYSEAFIRAVESHGWGICTEVEPVHEMEKALFAVDELTGFISACALMRPSKSVLDLEVKSVKKKWGAAAFAAKIRRDIIQKGADMMGLPLDELIQETILAMRTVHAEIGL
jgi:predicted hydrolase (HD superfamily)/AcrR family transcriptional regulator